jgi:hypothetical protein
LSSMDSSDYMEVDLDSSFERFATSVDDASLRSHVVLTTDMSTGVRGNSAPAYLGFRASPVRNSQVVHDNTRRTVADNEKHMVNRANKFANRFSLAELTPSFLDFVRWIFGQDGLPNLKILAIGDFSNSGRWAEYNMILCRDESLQDREGINFRTLMHGDFHY